MATRRVVLSHSPNMRRSGLELRPSRLESPSVRPSRLPVSESFERFLKNFWQIRFCVSQYFDYGESVFA